MRSSPRSRPRKREGKGANDEPSGRGRQRAAPRRRARRSAAARAAVRARSAGAASISTPALAGKVALNDTVFIFARAVDGPRMPLAVLRVPARNCRSEFALDDSMGMAPGSEALERARRSSSRRACPRAAMRLPQPGDLFGQAAPPVKPGAARRDDHDRPGRAVKIRALASLRRSRPALPVRYNFAIVLRGTPMLEAQELAAQRGDDAVRPAPGLRAARAGTALVVTGAERQRQDDAAAHRRRPHAALPHGALAWSGDRCRRLRSARCAPRRCSSVTRPRSRTSSPRRRISRRWSRLHGERVGRRRAARRAGGVVARDAARTAARACCRRDSGGGSALARLRAAAAAAVAARRAGDRARRGRHRDAARVRQRASRAQAASRVIADAPGLANLPASVVSSLEPRNDACRRTSAPASATDGGAWRRAFAGRSRATCGSRCARAPNSACSCCSTSSWSRCFRSRHRPEPALLATHWARRALGRRAARVAAVAAAPVRRRLRRRHARADRALAVSAAGAGLR